MKYQTRSEKETFKLAKDFAKKLNGGEVLLLIGDLGAGKTAFTKGLAAGLGIKNIITSPTFVLMKIYARRNKEVKKLRNEGKSGRLGLAHIDAYRLKEGSELINIGATDYFGDPEFVTVMEWAERVYPVKLLDKYTIFSGNEDKFINSLKNNELMLFNRVKDIWPKKKILIRFKMLENDKREITIK